MIVKLTEVTSYTGLTVDFIFFFCFSELLFTDGCHYDKMKDMEGIC